MRKKQLSYLYPNNPLSRTLATQATSACRQKWNGKLLIEANAIDFLFFFYVFLINTLLLSVDHYKKKPISEQEFLMDPKNPLKKSYL